MIDITYGAAPSEKTAVALGYFDGLHLGHVFVISCALNEKFAPAVFTFNCDTTLPKFQSPEDIISFENKCELLDKMGVKYIYAPDFAAGGISVSGKTRAVHPSGLRKSAKSTELP